MAKKYNPKEFKTKKQDSIEISISKILGTLFGWGIMSLVLLCIIYLILLMFNIIKGMF